VVSVQQAPAGDVSLARLGAPGVRRAELGLSYVPPHFGRRRADRGWGATSSVDPAPGLQLNTGQFTVSSVDPTAIASTVTGLPRSPRVPYDSGAPYFAESAHHRPQLVLGRDATDRLPATGAETTGRTYTLIGWIFTTIWS